MVPHCIDAVLECDRELASQANLYRFRWDPVGFRNRLVATDQTWIHIYMIQRLNRIQDMETKRFLASYCSRYRSDQARAVCFLGQRWVLFVDCLKIDAVITKKYYVALHDKQKQQLVSKCRGNLSKGILFRQDIAAITLHKLADLHSEAPKRPAYGLLTWLGPFGLLPPS